MNILDFKKIFEWIFWIFKKNEYFFLMNILDFYKTRSYAALRAVGVGDGHR